MKIYCEYSNIWLMKSDLLLGFDLKDVHPIFKAKKSILLDPNILHRFQQSQSWEEKKLYFLAVLNTTDLIVWETYADPAPMTVEHNFMDICRIAAWVDHVKFEYKEKVQYPQFVVRPDTRTLSTLAGWMSSMLDIRNIFMEKSKEDTLKRDLNERARQIEIEFRKAGMIGQAFTRQLAKWSLELTGVDDTNFGTWLNVLQTPLDEAWMLNGALVAEIQQHLQSTLPIYNDQAIAVLHQVKKLRDATRQGYTPGDNDDSDDDETTEDGKPISPKFGPKGGGVPRFEMLEDEPLNIPLPPKPDRMKFASSATYASAMALWEVQCAAIQGKNTGGYSQF